MEIIFAHFVIIRFWYDAFLIILISGKLLLLRLGLQHVTLIVVRPRLVVGQCALHRLHHPESDGWGASG